MACKINGCTSTRRGARGWCNAHYKQFLRHGDPLVVGRPGPIEGDLAERFWSKVDKRGPDECWEWTAGRYNSGYGQFWITDARKTLGAHRVSLWLATGTWPAEWVLHRCDNPPCVNPQHLFEGDNITNSADRATKGRARNGHTLATHCIRGHAFSGENLLVRSDGARACRACARERMARWVAKKISSH